VHRSPGAGVSHAAGGIGVGIGIGHSHVSPGTAVAQEGSAGGAVGITPGVGVGTGVDVAMTTINSPPLTLTFISLDQVGWAGLNSRVSGCIDQFSIPVSGLGAGIGRGAFTAS